MTREEFILALNKKLKFMNTQEKEEAINYYQEYIDDALDSDKDWEEISKSLGTPDEVAAKIKADYSVKKVKEKPSLSNSIKLLFAVLGLFFIGIPIAIPIAIGLLSIVLAIVIVIFAILITLIAVIISVIIALCALFGFAISLLVTNPVAGIGLLGLVLVGTGVIILFTYGVIRLTSIIFILLAKLIKKIIYSFRRERK